ncbi:MAG: tetratricopeptide repeat protein [Methylococcaceae bacterium]|nr:tetratricopeptide repeat protein [Methylococcaceae bacterium]
MVHYDTEDQQLDTIKKWFIENGRAVVLGLVIGIGCILGWNAWQTNKNVQAREASDLFQELLQAVDSANRDSLVKLGERIKTEYPDSPYAVYAGFFLAKQHVESGKMESARKELESVLAGSSEASIKNIARLRLLRILLAEGKSREALDLINGLGASGSGKFEAAYEELKGDAHVALGQEREARSAYKRASELGRTSKFLDLKVEDLPVPRAPEPAQ